MSTKLDPVYARPSRTDRDPRVFTNKMIYETLRAGQSAFDDNGDRSILYAQARREVTEVLKNYGFIVED